MRYNFIRNPNHNNQSVGGIRGWRLRPVPRGAPGLPGAGARAGRLSHRGAAHRPRGQPVQGLQLPHHEPARAGPVCAGLQGNFRIDNDFVVPYKYLDACVTRSKHCCTISV